MLLAGVPGLAGSVSPQLFHCHQHRVTISLRKRRAFTKEFWESLRLTQVDLDNMKFA